MEGSRSQVLARWAPHQLPPRFPAAAGLSPRSPELALEPCFRPRPHPCPHGLRPLQLSWGDRWGRKPSPRKARMPGVREGEPGAGAGLFSLGFLGADMKEPVVHPRERGGQDGLAPAQAGRLSWDGQQGGPGAGQLPTMEPQDGVRARGPGVLKGRHTEWGSRPCGGGEAGPGAGGEGSQGRLCRRCWMNTEASCSCCRCGHALDGKLGSAGTHQAGTGTQRRPGLRTRALPGLLSLQENAWEAAWGLRASAAPGDSGPFCPTRAGARGPCACFLGHCSSWAWTGKQEGASVTLLWGQLQSRRTRPPPACTG